MVDSPCLNENIFTNYICLLFHQKSIVIRWLAIVKHGLAIVQHWLAIVSSLARLL